MALALEFQNIPKARARDGARDWLARVGLGGFEKYYPHQVSGGMRQRALARAFIAQPQTMLMDEPFGALDALTRLSLQDVLRQLIAQERPTVLLVTHDGTRRCSWPTASWCSAPARRACCASSTWRTAPRATTVPTWPTRSARSCACWVSRWRANAHVDMALAA